MTSTNIIRSTDGGFTNSPIYTGSYASLSGRVGYKIGEWLTLSVSGTNLDRRVTQESPYPAIERQVFLTLTGRF
jgi:hypothetical protein